MNGDELQFWALCGIVLFAIIAFLAGSIIWTWASAPAIVPRTSMRGGFRSWLSVRHSHRARKTK